ncbi:MAG TPA: four helix bundle protein, partial [Thermomicrobiales bacterium]|nr:four helix bundle protein [Thermomicrobiales bacterium]
DLVAWQKGMDLVAGVYAATRTWPKEETFGLVNQIRRAVVSIPANIAEGQGRFGAKEFQHHLSIAYGSSREVETHVLIAQRLEYLTVAHSEQLLDQAAEVGRVLLGLLRSLRASRAERSDEQ